MNVATPSSIGTPAVRWRRLGDLGLCTLLLLVAVAPVVKTYHAFTEGSPLLGLHYALTVSASLIMAALLLVRREALMRATRRREQLAAVVGTFTIIPLGLLPLTWEADWLLEVTSVGFIVAYAWIVWSLLTLSRSFSIFPEARGLITHGPYAHMRHPLYAAYFFTYSMVAIPRFGLPAMLLTVVGIGAEVLRSRNEERLLRVAFPSYDAYASTVRAFLPIKRRAI